ncbi:hypothetical protein FLONG3_788 [Fusarium longipes]|uniref:Uncharacterized protein n=1 Tax=Fusarium longipes TaxID=694270 RepID=A0A395T8G0_9HYPO|nr:hypothetical protein FLONG3_788 [Fusarium longipes]
MVSNCRYSPTRYLSGKNNPKNVRYDRKWGYTVYRTYYGEESDEAWEMLLYSLEHQTKLAFGGIKNEDVNGDEVHVDPNDIQKLKNLFTIEGREDPSQLEGLDAHGVRDFWHAEDLKQSQNVVQQPGQRRRLTSRPDETCGMADWVHRFVLLADEPTLKDVANGEFVVKAIPLGWREGDSPPGGWMRIPTGSLLDLWIFLLDWSCKTEQALRFYGSEEELQSWIWAGNDNRECTGDYSEIRHFPHYNNQTLYESSWLKQRRAGTTQPCDQDEPFRFPIQASPEVSPLSSPLMTLSSPLVTPSSPNRPDDGKLRRSLRLKRRKLKAASAVVEANLASSDSDEDRPLRCRGLLQARRRKEHASEEVKAAEWGYPIYRTYYSPGSNESWNTLLELLKQQTLLELEALEGKDHNDVQKLKELFHLEARQDPTVLRALNIYELQEYRCDTKRDITRSPVMADKWFQFSLLADQLVPEDIEKGMFVVKAVSLLWTEHDDHPGFGWIRVPTHNLLGLWQQLLIWQYRKDDTLCFWGSAEDLYRAIWPGDGTGWCSKACPIRNPNCHSQAILNMTNFIEEMIGKTWENEKGRGRKDRKWGFTIYRTYYGEESDDAWQMLLYSLRHQTKLAFGAFAPDNHKEIWFEEEIKADDIQRLKDLFSLDVREDPALFNGFDISRLREFAKKEKEDQTQIINMGAHRRKAIWPKGVLGMAD